MINKTYISKLIHEKFPELERVSFSLNGRIINDFSQKTLYPFMIYQNTVDTLNRLITVYLPENSNSALLTPFISAVGVYRKGLELLMQEKNYINETFPNQEKQVVYYGNVCSIIRIDYINRLLILMEGKGRIHEIQFNLSSILKWSYRNAMDINSKLEEFKKIDKLKKKDIFTFPLVPEKKHFSGVLLFTNVSKFESLLRTIKISDSDIREHLKILKTAFPNNRESIDFHALSLKATNNKPASLIVSRTDSYKAFHNIINAGNGSLDHINTIIIDSFDEIILNAIKYNTLEEDLEFFKDNYFSKLGNGIKDIFLICSNRNFDIEKILKKKEINSHPWLLMPLEKIALDEYKPFKPEIFVSCIGDINFDETLRVIVKLLLKWKELAKTNFCNGKILQPIRNLISLREKWVSFYDPTSFEKFLLDFIFLLNQLKVEWFYNKMDYGLIDETISFCNFIKDNYKRSLLEFEINKLVKNFDEKASQVEFVSKNVDEIDREYFLQFLQKINSEIDFGIKNENEILLGTTSTISRPDFIIYLTWNKELLNSSLINPIAKQQVYLINDLGYQYIKSNYTIINRRIRNIGNSENKYRLLNIETDKEMTNSDEELISISFGPCKDEKENKKVIDVIPGIEEFVHDIIKVHINSDRVLNSVANDYMIFFDDGSHIDWPEHKKIFCYDENSESENTSIQKDISDLKVGDQIIISKRSRELRKVIDETLSENESFSKSIKTDHDWRDKILAHLHRNNWDIQFFRRKLRENGFLVETDFTVTNWIEGDTFKPNNFLILLKSLCKMGILNEAKMNEYYDQCTSLKSTKTTFVRRSVQKLILSLKGINYGEDDLFDEVLLDSFINHIEIKRVLGIVKNND